jgi:hypothetical protein
MRKRQANKIIKNYAHHFSTGFFDNAPWVYSGIPHRALKQKHVRRWFEGDDEGGEG